MEYFGKNGTNENKQFDDKSNTVFIDIENYKYNDKKRKNMFLDDIEKKKIDQSYKNILLDDSKNNMKYRNKKEKRKNLNRFKFILQTLFFPQADEEHLF